MTVGTIKDGDQETKEGVQTFNVKDADILEKLAKVFGCEVNDIPQNSFELHKKLAAEGRESDGWDFNGAKLFMLRTGEFVIANRSDLEAKKRAKAMGMRQM